MTRRQMNLSLFCVSTIRTVYTTVKNDGENVDNRADISIKLM